MPRLKTRAIRAVLVIEQGAGRTGLTAARTHVRCRLAPREGAGRRREPTQPQLADAVDEVRGQALDGAIELDRRQAGEEGGEERVHLQAREVRAEALAIEFRVQRSSATGQPLRVSQASNLGTLLTRVSLLLCLNSIAERGAASA